MHTDLMTYLKSACASKIKTIRSDLGFTMQEFARLIGVATNTVSRIENGRNAPSMKTLVSISVKTAIPIGYLLDKKQI